MVSISEPVDAKQARRFAALTEWAGRAAAAGYPVPSAAEISGIAAESGRWSEAAGSETAQAWAPTIAHLLLQVKMGVHPEVAVDQLPSELLRPARELTSSSAPAPPVADSTVDVAEAANLPDSRRHPTGAAPDRNAELVEELMAWRAAHIGRGTEGAEAIKDVTLRNLVKFNHTDAEQIGKRIPGPAAHLAPEIANVMARFGAQPTSSPATPDVAQSAPRQANGQPSAQQPVAEPAPPPPSIRLQASQPSHEPPRHFKSDGAILNLDHNAFCAYAYEDSDVEPTRITFKSTPEGVRLSFDAYSAEAGKMVIYRVVSGENSAPFKPEVGEIVAVTTGLQVYDPRFASSAVRAYQVWCHVGLDQEDACRTQPFLLATGEQVSPIEDFQIAEDEGRVIGRWSVFPGTDAVLVSRIPLSGDVDSHDEEQFRICTHDLNLTGFVDTTAERGQRYLYRAQAKVAVGDAPRLSSVSQHELLVSVVLQPVLDLEVSASGDNDAEFDLRWTEPDAGEVRIYRLHSGAPGGLEGKEIDEAALEPQGFTGDTRVNYPVSAAGPGVAQMRGVPWPKDWQRAYLVPVTVLNGRARVGRTQITSRKLPPVIDAQIVERYHTEIVTFGWPQGAASVKAFIGLASADPDETCRDNAPKEELTKARWDRDGGLTFSDPLPANGCQVCLVPVAYSRAEEIRGHITCLQYPGLVRIDYWLVSHDGGPVAELVLRSDVDVEVPPAIMLINNAARFPLSPDDGQYIKLRPRDRTESVPQLMLDRIPRDVWHTGVTVDLSNVGGFYRLFFESSDGTGRPLGLHDPALIAIEDNVCSLWRDPYQGSTP